MTYPNAVSHNDLMKYEKSDTRTPRDQRYNMSKVNQFNITRPEIQYLMALADIADNGVDIKNQRTGLSARTAINKVFTYDCTTTNAPLLTSRKVPSRLPIAELLGYFRGYRSASQFRAIGTKSWDANANETPAWLNNPHRRGHDDLGVIYGAVANNWPTYAEVDMNESPIGIVPKGSMDLFEKVYQNLLAGNDDRGEIITYWNPSFFEFGSLRPCMHSFQFSLLGDDLYLNATQRSADFPLGVPANMVQVYVMLRLMAQITNKNPKLGYHTMVNCHIYENQLAKVEEQLAQPLLDSPKLKINPDIKTLNDIRTWVTVDDFVWEIPDGRQTINYPFAV